MWIKPQIRNKRESSRKIGKNCYVKHPNSKSRRSSTKLLPCISSCKLTNRILSRRPYFCNWRRLRSWRPKRFTRWCRLWRKSSSKCRLKRMRGSSRPRMTLIWTWCSMLKIRLNFHRKWPSVLSRSAWIRLSNLKSKLSICSRPSTLWKI